MRKSILLVLLFILILGLNGQAQSDQSLQIDDLAERLKRYSGELFQQTYGEIKSDSSNNRKEIEQAFLSQQFEASVGLFQQMLGDKRSNSDLADASKILKKISGDLPKNKSNESLLRNIENTVKDIENAIANLGKKNNTSDNKPKEPEDNRPVLGRAFWRGMVDRKVQLIIKSTQIETRTVEGGAQPDGTFTFTAALPGEAKTVGVNKQEGRGSANVIQQPTSENDFTAIVEIVDEGGGAKEYQLEIFWK